MNDAMMWLVDTVRAASWVDVLDIVLLAMVIYGILTVMRGTRALQSLLGAERTTVETV